MESSATFQSMWANFHGEPGHPGIYHHFQHGDIAFFMLDDRFYRSPNRSEDRGDKTMLVKDSGPGSRQVSSNPLPSSNSLPVVVSGKKMVTLTHGPASAGSKGLF